MPRKANTRAASGAGSIRQRPDGRWEARVTVGNDPGTGKPIRRSIYGNTQKEVLTAMRDAQKAIDDGLYIEPTRLTLAQWLDIWQSDYLLSQKYGTVKTYKAQIATHIKPALGAVKLTKLTPHIIQGFYNDLLANGRIVPKRDKQGKIIKKDGVAVTETAPLNAKTVRNVHGVLTKALSQAVKVGYIARNPCDMVDLPRVEKAQIMPLTDEQVKSYLAAADTDNDYGDILKVILFTGLREAEALGLTWDCVDFKKGTLKICKQLQKRPAEAGGFQFAALKNDKTRILRPAPFVMDMLRAVRSKQAQRRLQAGDLWQDWIDPAKQYAACRLVFTNALGDHLHPQRLYAHHKKIAAKAGAPDARVHDLRHTFAALSLQNGDDVKTVQENLGHATAAFTLDVYGHVSERMKEDSAARMQGYFENLNHFVDVAAVAGKFGGGGHVRAAGFSAVGDINEIYHTAEALIKEQLDTCTME